MRKQNYFLMAFTLFLLCSCTQLKDFNNNSNQWKPKDFDPTVGVLLIQNVDLTNGQIHRLEKWMKRNYPYKYEFVKKAYNKDSAYSDRTKYRFALVPSKKESDVVSLTPNTGTTNPMSSGSSYTTRKVNVYDFNFYDRLKKISSAKSGLFASTVKLPFKTIIKKCLKDMKKE